MRVISALVLILSTALVAAALPEAVPSLVARDNNDSSSLAAEAAEISSEDLSAEGHRKERKKAEKAIEKLNAKSSQLQSTLMELFNKKILWRPRGEDFNWIPGEEWEIQYNWCVEDKRWAYKLQFAKGRELDFMKAELLRCSTLMFTWRASTGKPSWFAHSCHWWMDIFEPYHVLFIQRLNHPAPDSCTVTDCPRLLEARNMTDFFRWAVEKGEHTPMTREEHPPGPTTPPPHPNRYN